MAATAHAGHLPGAFASGPQFPPSIMVPVEMYESLVSVNNLHQRLVYGPRGHEFLDLVRTIYALQPTGATSTAEESRHGWGRAAPPLRNDPRRAAADSGAVRHPAAGNSTPRPIHRALQRIRRRHEHAKGIPPPRLHDMTHDAILRLDLELEGLHVAHLREKQRSSEEEPLPAPSREGFCATGESCPLDGEPPPRDDAGAIAAVDPLDGESPPGDDTGATDEADPLDGESPPGDDVGAIAAVDPLDGGSPPGNDAGATDEADPLDRESPPRDDIGAIETDEAYPLDGESPPRDDFSAIDAADPLTSRDNTGAIDDADPLDGESLSGDDTGATEEADPLDGESLPGDDTGATDVADPLDGESPPGDDFSAIDALDPLSPRDNVHPAAVKPSLTDTNHGLNPLLPSSNPSMGSGLVESSGSVSQSPDDMSPAPDANAAAKVPDEDLLHICAACGDRLDCDFIGGDGWHVQCDGCHYDKNDYYCGHCFTDELGEDFPAMTPSSRKRFPHSPTTLLKEQADQAVREALQGIMAPGSPVAPSTYLTSSTVPSPTHADTTLEILPSFNHLMGRTDGDGKGLSIAAVDSGMESRNTCTRNDAEHTFEVARELAPGPNAPDEGIRTNALDADRACHDPPPTKNRKPRSRSKKKKKKSKSPAHKRWSTGDADDIFFDAIDRVGSVRVG